MRRMCGSSPFSAPATLMLIAHVEQDGVWLVEGGMHQLALALERAARALGVQFRYNSRVTRILVERGRAEAVLLQDGERLESDGIVVNADCAALAAGCFGEQVTARGAAHAARATLGIRGDLEPARHDRRLSAVAAQRVLFLRLRRRVRRHFQARGGFPPSRLSMSVRRIAMTATAGRRPARSGCCAWSTHRHWATAARSTPRRSANARTEPSECWSAAA